jgi:hypothetical protein
VGEAAPNDPEDRPKPPDAPRPPIGRADWLVGAEEGVEAEMDRMARGAPAPFDAPRLARPLDPVTGRPSHSTRMDRPKVGEAPLNPAPVMPAWDRGRSSVPAVRHSPKEGMPPSSPIPELTRDFPMDDAEERARVAGQLAEQQAREAAIAARPHEVVRPQEFDIPAVPLPWWSQLPQLVRFDRRVQLVALSLVLGLALIATWPRGERMISVAHLKEHAERYADTRVRVRGRVSEVFAVGGSWAYTLVQGRDTIVVFSRTRRPQPRERVVVVGTLSNGYLDGQSRAAIFESTR